MRKKKDKPESDIDKLQKHVKKLEDGAEKLEDEIEKLADELEELEDKPGKPPKKAKRIAILNNQTGQEIKMDIITLGKERVYTAEGRDAQNNPAPLLAGDVPVWSASPTGIVTLFPTSDGMSCEVVAAAAGACTLTVTGKDVKAGSVSGSADISVPGAEPPLATRIELTAGPEIPV